MSIPLRTRRRRKLPTKIAMGICLLGLCISSYGLYVTWRDARSLTAQPEFLTVEEAVPADRGVQEGSPWIHLTSPLVLACSQQLSLSRSGVVTTTSLIATDVSKKSAFRVK